MLRYYISDVIGDGLTTDTGYRAAIGDLIDQINQPFIDQGKPPIIRHGTSNIKIVPGPDGRGVPAYDWVLVCVRCADHRTLAGHAQTFGMPVWPLDGTVAGIELVTRGRLKAFLATRGIIADVDSLTSYRSVINAIGLQHEPLFDADKFDVPEPIIE